MESVNNGESSSPERERKYEDWSSLPALLIWMVKDKLDIFDNKRFAAVCRDWLSASNSYPKLLQSVGDGLPWITPVKPLCSSMEFISVARKYKLKVSMPECVDHEVLFSKQGWILLTRGDNVLLVNLFTRSRIELPPPGPRNMGCCSGCFTTDGDGYPKRVFLLVLEDDDSGVAVVKTCSPGGDEEWTDHTFLGHGMKFSLGHYFVTIGDYVYSRDWKHQITAFNVSDQTWKKLPPPTDNVLPSGFIVEHEGDLLFVQRVSNHEENSLYKFSSFALLYKYDVVACSWKRVSYGDVKDTTWFYHITGGCIATKGKGLKIYHLRRYSSVKVYDLLTGNREILPVPFHVPYLACWVDIG